MDDNSILSVDDAHNLSICLLAASERMPALTAEARLVLLEAAGLLAEHSCSAAIAQAETAQLLGRTNRLKSAMTEVGASHTPQVRRGIWAVLNRLVGSRVAKPCTANGRERA